MTVNSMLQKSLGRKDLLTSVWLELGKSINFDEIPPGEREAVNKYLLVHADLGLNAKQIVDAFLKDAASGRLGDFGDSGTDNFTNTRSPGQPEPIISAKPGRGGRNVGRSDDAFVGQNTSDRKHKPGYPQVFGDPSFGHESDELTISDQDYGSQREIAGTGQDLQGTRTTTKPTRYTGLGQEGGQQPDHPERGPGLSGNYGRGAFLESQKAYGDTQFAKSKSRFLSPERLQAFRMGKPIPTVNIPPESRKTVLTKGINDVFVKKARRDDEQGSFGVGGPTTFSEESVEDVPLTKLGEDEAKLEEARRLDEEAKRLLEQGFVEEAVDRREKAMKLRSQISKQHGLTTMKAHLQHGREPI